MIYVDKITFLMNFLIIPHNLNTVDDPTKQMTP